jgi:hypothetical protein
LRRSRSSRRWRRLSFTTRAACGCRRA